MISMDSKVRYSRIVLCYGKSCRKRKKSHKKLMALLPSAKKGKCMGLCKGPIVLVKDKKQSFLFYKLRKKKDRIRLEKFLLTGKRSKKLKTRKA